MHLSSLTDYTASDLASLLGTRLEPSPDPTRPLLPLNFTSSSTGGDGSSSGGGARRSVLPSTLPTYWNWVDQGMVTSVKNQGNVSGGAKACWECEWGGPRHEWGGLRHSDIECGGLRHADVEWGV